MNYLNAISSAVLGGFIQRRILEFATSTVSLTGVNEVTIIPEYSIDELQQTRITGTKQDVFANYSLSAHNSLIPSSDSLHYLKHNEIALSEIRIQATNTEVESVSALDKGIASVDKDSVSFFSNITKATNTEVESVSALDKGIASVDKDSALQSSNMIKATNTEVESVSALDKGIASVDKDSAL
jgi:vacuolar-type H+-ATPase subunit I/STV1